MVWVPGPRRCASTSWGSGTGAAAGGALGRRRRGARRRSCRACCCRSWCCSAPWCWPALGALRLGRGHRSAARMRRGQRVRLEPVRGRAALDGPLAGAARVRRAAVAGPSRAPVRDAASRSGRGCSLLLPLGSLSASAGLVSALDAARRRATRRRRPRARGCRAGRCLPRGQRAVAGRRPAARLARDLDRARGRSSRSAARARCPGPLAALTLGGIWNAEVVPGVPRQSCCWLVARPLLRAGRGGARRSAPLLAPARRRAPRARWWRCGLVGYALALLTWAAPGRGRLGRRATCPAAACSATAAGPWRCALRWSAALVAAARPSGSAHRSATRGPGSWSRVAAALLPLALLPDAAWGLGRRRSQPVDYPDDYAAARAAVAGSDAPAATCWCCRSPATAPRRGTTAARCSTRWAATSRPNYLVSDQLRVVRAGAGGGGPAGARGAGRAARCPTPEARAARARRARDRPGRARARRGRRRRRTTRRWPAPTLHDGPELRGGPARRAGAGARTPATWWAAALAAGLGGFLGAARWRGAYRRLAKHCRVNRPSDDVPR